MCQKDKKHQDPNSQAHHEEHEAWSRRTFLQALGIAGAGTFTLAGSQISSAMASPITAALNSSTNDRVLVLIRLKGGNDGLNTIVPLNDYSTYAAGRPNIALAQNTLYNLDVNNGLPNFMSSLQSRWGNGEMKVIHGVGIGSLGNLAFEGLQTNYAFSVADPNQLAQLAQNGWQHDALNVPPCTYGDQLSYLRTTTNTTFAYAGVINNAFMASATQANYNNNTIAEQLALVARLIKGNLGTKVYMVTLGGFDTHANQASRHANRMQQLTDAIDEFYTDLAGLGIQNEVLAMTISEFGRRVEENGSNGTDHGAAAPMMMFGPGLNGNGFIGTQPSLTQLDAAGNMIHSVDFRDIYSTVMKEWLCIPAATVDQAMLSSFNTINLGFNCTTLGATDVSDLDFKHIVINRDEHAILNISLDTARKMDIRIFNFMGQELGQLKNDYMMPGNHEINIKQTLQTRMPSGVYIYRIETGGKQYSNQFLMR